MDRGAWRATAHGVTKELGTTERLNNNMKKFGSELALRAYLAQMVKKLPAMQVRMILWRRQWPPIPVFLPGKSHGQRTLVGSGVAKSRTRLGH